MKKVILVIALSVGWAGCQSLGPNAAGGGALGGLAGGLAGAAIGAAEGKAPEGALVGAVAGATAGTIAGDAWDRDIQQQRLANQQLRDQQFAHSTTIDQVIRMTHSELGPEVISRHIMTQGVARRPTIEDLILLKQNRVDDRVIEALQTATIIGPGGSIAVHSRPVGFVERVPVFVESYPRFGPRRFGPHCHPAYRPGVELFFGF